MNNKKTLVILPEFFYFYQHRRGGFHILPQINTHYLPRNNCIVGLWFTPTELVGGPSRNQKLNILRYVITFSIF